MRTSAGYSLRWALPVGLLSLMLAIMALSLVNAYWNHQGALLTEARQSLLTEAHRLARLAADEGTLGRGRVATELSLAGADARVRHALLLDPSGRILAAQRKEWVGRMAGDVVPGLDMGRLEQALGNSQPEYLSVPGVDAMDVFLSHARPADQGELRGHDRGAVYLSYDLRAARAEMLHIVIMNRVPELLGILFLTFLLYRLISRHVVRHLARVEAASRRLSQGEAGVRVPESGPAELAGLAHSFNAMAEAVTNARRDLEASEERLAITLQSIGDALIATDLEGRVTLMNPVAEVLTGWPREQAMGQPVEMVFSIENAQTGAPAEIPVERVIRDGLAVGLAHHTVLVSRDGTRYHIADSAAPIRHRDGALLGVVMVFRDVSGAYALRHALEESEQHFRTLANAGQALIWTAGLDKGCDYFNEIWLRFTGRSLQQELGDGWAEGVHPDDLEECMATYTEAFDRRQPFSMVYRLRRHDGVYRWIQDDGTPRYDGHGAFIGYIGHCLDVTEARTRELQQALAMQVLATLNRGNDIGRLVEDLLRLLKESTGIEAVAIRLAEGSDFPYVEAIGFPDDFLAQERFLCARTTDGEIECNDQGEPVLDCICGRVLSGEWAPGKPGFTPHGSYWACSSAAASASIDGAGRQATIQGRCFSEGYETIALIPLRSGDQTIGLLQLNDHRPDAISQQMVEFLEGLGASIGIAVARQRAAQACQESEEKYRLLAESTEAILWEYDIVTDRWTYVAPQVERILGYRPEEWTNLQFWEDHLHEDDRAWATRCCAECTARGEAHQFEYRFIAKDGDAVWLRDVVSVEMEDGRPVRLRGFMQDISMRKQAEEDRERLQAQLTQAQKMEAIGQLAGGVAHRPLGGGAQVGVLQPLDPVALVLDVHEELVPQAPDLPLFVHQA